MLLTFQFYQDIHIPTSDELLYALRQKIYSKMGSKIEYVESSHMYATNYIRNSKAIGVLWGIFTICYAIIGVVAFVTPEWLGDLEHENPGRFGLWTRCSYGGNGKLIKPTSLFFFYFLNIKFSLNFCHYWLSHSTDSSR